MASYLTKDYSRVSKVEDLFSYRRTCHKDICQVYRDVYVEDDHEFELSQEEEVMEAVTQMQDIKAVFRQIQNRLEQVLPMDEVAKDETEYKRLLASIRTYTLQMRQMATAIKAFRIGIPLLSEVKTLADRVHRSASQQSMKHLERLEDRHQKYLESCATINRFSSLTEQRVTLGDKISVCRVSIEDHLAGAVSSGIPDSPKPSTTQHRSKLRIELPDFNGEPLQWTTFWKLFSRLVDKEDDLSEEEKLHLLIKSMKNKDAEHIAKTTAANNFSYDEVVEVLKTKYDRPRANFSLHMKNLVQKRKTDYTFKSMEELCISIQQLLGGLETCQGLSAT